MQDVKKDRNKYIGGSDIPIIMGISPFKTRWQLLQEKAGLIDDEFEGNEYTEYGNIMEPKIRDYINQTEQKDPFKEGKHIEGVFRCHTDGENKEMTLEIKTTSQVHETVDEYKYYLVQLLHYMNKTKRKYGLLAVYHRPEDFSTEFDKDRLQEFDVKLKDYKELLEEINKAIEQFLTDLERLKENPFLSEEDLMPKDIVELSNKVEIIEKQLSEYKELEKNYKEEKEKLRKAMLDSGIKSWETPNGTKITLIYDTPDKEVEETYFNTERLREANEKVYNKYLEKRTVIKKGKAGSIRITLPE